MVSLTNRAALCDVHGRRSTILRGGWGGGKAEATRRASAACTHLVVTLEALDGGDNKVHAVLSHLLRHVAILPGTAQVWSPARVSTAGFSTHLDQRILHRLAQRLERGVTLGHGCRPVEKPRTCGSSDWLARWAVEAGVVSWRRGAHSCCLCNATAFLSYFFAVGSGRAVSCMWDNRLADDKRI